MGDTIRVLLVDDAADLATVATELLEREDARLDVTSETSPDAGLDRLESETFDCLVTDYQMPGADGLEVLRIVRERWPALPVILFTGEGSEEVASRAIAAGATDYVQKSTGTDQYALLANRIVQAVSKRRSDERAARLERVRELARDVNQRLVRADDTATVDRSVCARLVDADPYDRAMIGETTVDTDGSATGLVVRAVEPDDNIDIDGVELAAGDAIRTAATERTVAVVRGESPVFGDGISTTVAVPLDYESDAYGLLVVGAADSEAVGELEVDFLDELGTDVASALHGLDIRSDLRESEAKYRRLVEQNLVGVYLIQDGEFEYVNPRLAAMFGYTQAEFLAEVTPFDVVVEAEQEKLRQNLARRESGAVDDLRYTLRGQRKDGSEIEFEVHGGRIDYRGEPAVMGTLLDVTQQRRHERELERSRAEYRELFESFPDAVFVGAPGDTFQAVNDTAVERLGYSREELLSMRPEDIDPNRDATLHEKIDDLSRDRIVTFETTHRTKAGDEIPVESNATLIPYRGETAILATARDITDRVERERELRRRNDRLEEFASVVSHDLRNPLNVAAGRLNWAREEYDNRQLDDAASALERMDRLIDDLLALTRRGRDDIDPTVIDLAGLVDRCWSNVATSNAVLDAQVEGTIRADPSRVAQVFENLIRNAVEHGSRNAVEYDSPGNRTQSGDSVEPGSTSSRAPPDDEEHATTPVIVTVGSLPNGFYVADDGPGIPAEEREQVFETGYSTASGTGLGLSIVRSVVEAHDWEISVTESDAGGARFEITGVETGG
ncbi:MAG: PAS domain S-box protein [Haloplanus sp.]